MFMFFYKLLCRRLVWLPTNGELPSILLKCNWHSPLLTTSCKRFNAGLDVSWHFSSCHVHYETSTRSTMYVLSCLSITQFFTATESDAEYNFIAFIPCVTTVICIPVMLSRRIACFLISLNVMRELLSLGFVFKLPATDCCNFWEIW